MPIGSNSLIHVYTLITSEYLNENEFFFQKYSFDPSSLNSDYLFVCWFALFIQFCCILGVCSVHCASSLQIRYGVSSSYYQAYNGSNISIIPQVDRVCILLFCFSKTLHLSVSALFSECNFSLKWAVHTVWVCITNGGNSIQQT